MSARVAARGEGVAVFNARHPVRWRLAPDFSALALRRSEFQTLEVLPDGLAKALAARDRRTASHHEDEIAARRAAHFPHVAHVDQARAADAQHRLALEGLLGLLQGAARVVGLAADDEANIIAVGLDHLDLRYVQHVHAAAGLGQDPRLSLGAYPRAVLELLDERRERAVPIAGTVRIVTAAHTRKRGPEARLVEGLQEVVDRAHLEGLQRVLIVGRDEHDEREGLSVERARQREPRHRVHLDVEEQHVRRARTDRLEGGARIAVLADDRQVRLALAALANRAPRDRLVVDDHHLHQAAAPPSGRAAPSGPSRSSGMRSCATDSPSAPGPASKPARSPNCTVRHSRTLAIPTPTRPPSLPGATVLRTRSVSSSPSTRASTRIVTAPSCPASSCTTAFSTSGCRIRLGTQARACASRAGTSMVSRSAKRLCCSSRYSVTNCSSSDSRENSRSPAFRSRRSRSPSCTTIAWAAGGSQAICPRMVCSRLKSVCGESCMRSAARCARVRARSSAAERSCESRRR